MTYPDVTVPRFPRVSAYALSRQWSGYVVVFVVQ